MKIIRTDDTYAVPASATEALWAYNGMDCCVTMEVFEALVPQLDNLTSSVYEFSKALQGPVLEMKLRGVRVDETERQRAIGQYQKDIDHAERNLFHILAEGIGLTEPFNWRSPAQLQTLLYSVLGLPPVRFRGKPTVNRDALERLENYFIAQPIVSHLLLLRDIAKKIGVLRSEVDSDGRMRTSYNIAGTTTGRFSSSFNDFGAGTNLQNIEQRLRRIFVADPGMKFAYIDLEQAESRLVGAIVWNLFNDGRYLDACESGDLHTYVSQLSWPELPWGDNSQANREVAERPFYRHHSYRHMAKVLGHGTNYRGTPATMSKHTKIDTSVIKEFQFRYFAAFPGIRRWHERVAARLLEDGHLVSLMGRRRWFFGRRNDDSTIREAIAFDPQGSVGDILNRGMLQVWRAGICQLLLQVHDAILIQYPEEREDEIVPAALQLIKVPVELRHGRTLVIPSEAKVGWNWSDAEDTNPDGLIKYKGGDRRIRTPIGAPASILDRGF